MTVRPWIVESGQLNPFPILYQIGNMYWVVREAKILNSDIDNYYSHSMCQTILALIQFS